MTGAAESGGAAALARAAREVGGRVIAALAGRYRDLDLAEEAFADACARAAEAWPRDGPPRDPAAWLYRSAERRALDALRRRGVRGRRPPAPPAPEPTPEEAMTDDVRLIPDERLRLIFVCCHPAVAADARAALTLRLVCGLTTGEIARAFLISETALAQRLVRAKRKIAQAGVPFEVPGPDAWGERLASVLSTLEVAYAQAHADAAGAGPHAGYAREMLDLTRVLADLLPAEPDVLAYAALVRYAEARRPARMDETGAMTPLSDQDPALWRRPLIAEADGLLRRSLALKASGAHGLRALIHQAWCARPSLSAPPPWPRVLALYDALLAEEDSPILRLNRAVALAEVDGPAAAMVDIERLGALGALDRFAPWWSVRADLLRRLGRRDEARVAYDAVLALGPGPAERLFVERRRASLSDG